MPSIKYKDSTTGNMLPVSVKVGDTLPVGTELDYDGNSVPLGWEQVADGDLIVSSTEPSGNDRRKVWLQSNENIFDGVLESGTITDQGVNADNPDRKRSKNYLEVKENQTYTIRFNGNANVIVLFYSSNKTFLSQIPSTWGSQPYTFTTPTNTAYIRFISQDTTTTKALLKAGDEAPADEMNIQDKTYILDDDNIYRPFIPNKGIILWENSSPNNSFASQTINLNDSLLNYEYYEVIYNRTNGDYSLSSGKIPTNRNAMLSVFRSYGFIRGVNIATNTTLTIGEATRYDSYGGSSTSVDNNYCIPEKVIGYK